MLSKFILLAISTACMASVVLAGSNAKSEKWLQENAKKDGVITLASGLQYKVIKTGDGTDSPTADSSCSCHYHGTLIDGTVFDSSYDRGSPTSFAPNQVIKGWTEAMQMMVEGDIWELYIPSDIAYGDRGSPPKIQGGDALIFKLEMIKINGDRKPANRCVPKDPSGCSDKQKKYIAKMEKKNLDTAGLEKEIARLTKMSGKSMKPELQAWITQRKAILNKMVSAKNDL